MRFINERRAACAAALCLFWATVAGVQGLSYCANATTLARRLSMATASRELTRGDLIRVDLIGCQRPI